MKTNPKLVIALLVAILVSSSLVAQIRVNDGTYAVYTPPNAKGTVKMKGRYFGGYLKYIYEIAVGYTNDVAGTPAEVNYTIKSEINKEENGYLERSTDGNKLIVSRDARNRTKLTVSGTIKQTAADGKTKTADLSDIVIAPDGDIFSSWLLATNSNFALTKLSAAQPIQNSPVELGDLNTKLDASTVVSLFRLRDDFKLEIMSQNMPGTKTDRLISWEKIKPFKGGRTMQNDGKDFIEFTDWPGDMAHSGNIAHIGNSVFAPVGCVIGDDGITKAFGLTFKGKLQVTKDGLLLLDGAELQ